MTEITIQTTEEAAREIEGAARASGRSVPSFVRDAALNEAQRAPTTGTAGTPSRPWLPVVPQLRHALVIIRAWVQRGSSESLRATIRNTADVSSGLREISTTVTTPEAGAQAVKVLLEDIVEADRVDEQAEKSHRQ